MKIKLNPDQEIVNTIREGLKRTGGYCPCRVERTEENRCMCQEFKDQIADPLFEGFCHCMLYSRFGSIYCSVLYMAKARPSGSSSEVSVPVIYPPPISTLEKVGISAAPSPRAV